MFFVLRALFWIGLVLFFLPADSAPKARLAGAVHGLPAASEIVASGVGVATHLCTDRPQLCAEVATKAAALSAAPRLSSERDAPATTASLPPLPPKRPAGHEIAR
jgi:hypothetical protein